MHPLAECRKRKVRQLNIVEVALRCFVRYVSYDGVFVFDDQKYPIGALSATGFEPNHGIPR